ncbi:hypothetical protein [Paenibacillus hexagrammi]|uniref:Uncharacterized protein n=1 Tax=Paenibacillus hexagrammi TaxID=2908839 RepID=A0ABY3SSC9_9BACL|nr:hypothetical protein [Paenibacillus sp. YPD9-1]UJF36559.1 hypothetical protein L0M14_30695 [Paenibacillus sp. YPD9-1]
MSTKYFIKVIESDEEYGWVFRTPQSEDNQFETDELIRLVCEPVPGYVELIRKDAVAEITFAEYTVIMDWESDPECDVCFVADLIAKYAVKRKRELHEMIIKTAKGMESRMSNLLNHQDQIYLLQFWLRSNFEDVILAALANDNEELRRLIADHLFTEFEITNEDVIGEIYDLFVQS